MLERTIPTCRGAQDEIGRRGDYVEHVDGVQGDEPIADVMQMPPDDSAKWHFTIVSTKSCKACEQLRADFRDSPVLACWVNVADYKKSWAHYQVVDVADATQAWRWKDFKPTAFPTLIVQPPGNGSWGDPHTVVFLQTGRLDPNELDKRLRKAISQYATKVHHQHQAWNVKQAQSPPLAAGIQQTGGPPPFEFPVPLPAPVQQPQYQMIPPPQTQAPSGQPAAAGLGEGLWIKLLTMLVGTDLGLKLLLPFLKKWEDRAKSTPNPFDDLVTGFVRKSLEDRLNLPRPSGP